MRRSSLSVAIQVFPARRFRVAARLVDWAVDSESMRQGGPRPLRTSCFGLLVRKRARRRHDRCR
jgi:hypothetical protein